MENFPRYMNLGQACLYLNVKSRTTLRTFIKGGLRVTVVNGTKRIDRKDADEFMESHKQSDAEHV
ncbi:helix-turn-helix domain-containing protein [Lactiplantibacillus plantarum]|uniref:helix-turn-helix domain-containing protein n=1 Tax=Lactiplantibacillus TaxID=2767842 RepID=UPI0007C52529|nr:MULTISPECIES: helix-turn-helix domain-containing protein [Lactiplantibacillus]ANI96407.1 hypothetical protein A9F05_12910 [Lactiplantibacillus plantarum]AYG27902.1 DNA-binding protein [Lactiplantibacillus plantarum]AYG29451.1 DNA-binding protein [Lactiplantibacillus plantarum]AYG29462.1 DNA-binding protein [Lactiplantibacillus plantarum]MDC6396635.1 helix-turn-helix domain-containing protein [Lactiplantibacillus pentosus]